MREIRFQLLRAIRPRVVAAFAVGIGIATAACHETTAPITKTSNDLHFLRVAANTPPLVATTATIWAKYGQGSVLTLWYQPAVGETDSTKFLEFILDGASLAKRPDGRAFAPGDSILITVSVPDPTQIVVQFSPAGLQFSAEHPARLRMYFGECGDDLNHDGAVDSEDTAAQQQLSVWRQEAVSQPWYKVASVLVSDQKEVDGTILGFTGYALAY